MTATEQMKLENFPFCVGEKVNVHFYAMRVLCEGEIADLGIIKREGYEEVQTIHVRFPDSDFPDKTYEIGFSCLGKIESA